MVASLFVLSSVNNLNGTCLLMLSSFTYWSRVFIHVEHFIFSMIMNWFITRVCATKEIKLRKTFITLSFILQLLNNFSKNGTMHKATLQASHTYSFLFWGFLHNIHRFVVIGVYDMHQAIALSISFEFLLLAVFFPVRWLWSVDAIKTAKSNKWENVFLYYIIVFLTISVELSNRSLLSTEPIFLL